MSEYVDLALRSGVRIIGACCGSTPDHVAAIREAVDAFIPSPRPERSEIETRLEAALRPSPTNRREGRRRG
jgi:5-methyltetrahydrofolate--homocysteine methyltransferase